MVEPRGLDIVELRAVLRAFLQVEQLDHLVQAHHLLVVAGIPTEQGQEIHHGLGQIALLAIAGAYLAALGIVPFEGKHGEAEFVAVALAQLAVAHGLQQQGQVGEAGHRVGPTESTVEQHVKGCAGQPLLSADDVGHLHQMVVNDVGQVVGGQLVGTLVKHLVVQDAAVDGHLATNHVVHHHVFSGLDQEAHHVLMPLGNQAVHLFPGQGERVAHLQARACVVLEVLNFITLGVKLLGRIKGDVGLAGVKQALHVLLIYIAALALAIGTVVAAEAHTLVELNAQPAEALEDILLGAGHEAGAVSVFNTENQLTTMLTGEKIIVKGGTHAADMKGSRGTGGEAYTNVSR